MLTSLVEAANLAASQNCIFLLRDAELENPILSPDRLDFLQRIIKASSERCQDPFHALIALHSQREASVIAKELDSLGLEVIEISGHADIVELRLSVLQKYKLQGRQIIVTTSICLLHLFCLGLLRIRELNLIFFDDVSGANNNHPFCVVMESFYSPMLAESFMQGAFNGPFTRIVGFAKWPRILPGENFQVKMNRITKLNQYHRLFHCSIIPLAMMADNGSIKGADLEWMSESELAEVTETSPVFGLSKVSLVKPDSNINDELELILNEHVSSDIQALIICRESEVNSTYQSLFDSPRFFAYQLVNVTDKDAPIFCSKPGNIIITGAGQHSLIQSALQSSLTVIVLMDTEPDATLTLMLLACSHKTQIIFIRRQALESLKLQAADMLGWITALSCSATPSSDMARQLKLLLGNLYSLAKAAPFVADESIFHKRIPSTGAMMLPSFNATLLLAVCSYLPKKQGPLKLRTIPVKRVDQYGEILDKERHYFISKVSLPAILASEGFLPSEELEITGHLAPSRFQSVTSAAFEALKRMYNYKAIDENLIPCDKLLSFEDADEIVDISELEEGIPLNEAECNREIKEIIPDSLQYNNGWKEISKDLIAPVQLNFKMFLHVFEYETKAKDQFVELADTKIPYGSLIHMTDVNFFSSQLSGRTFALVFPRPLDDELRNIEIPFGPRFLASGNLITVKEVTITKDEMEKLLEFQVFIFGTINVRPIAFDNTHQLDVFEENSKDPFSFTTNECVNVPDDKKMAYLVALVKKEGADKVNSVLDIKDAEEKYLSFANNPLDVTHILSLEREEKHDWKLDWELMSDAICQEKYVTLEDVLDLIQTHALSLPSDFTPPSFITSPDKPPMVIDFTSFYLRRLVLYAPHNGIFYRIKRFRSDISPASEFESKSLPDCRSYADYMRLRYGLVAQNPNKRGLCETKRIENFVDLNKWFSLIEKAKSKGTHRKKTNNKSIIIPEFAKVAPIPYALLRILMLLPRVIFDLEKQLLAVQFYKDQLKSLEHIWPPFRVMVEALTGPTASIGYDYERMEILGDCVLKLFTTIDVFLHYRNYGEGQLSSKRQERISNFNLYMVSVKLNLPQYSRLTPFNGKLFTPPEINGLLQHYAKFKDRWIFVDLLFDDGQFKWRTVHDLDERADRRFALFHLYPDGKLVDAGQKAQDPIQYKYKKRAAGLPVVTRFGFSIPPKSLADLMESTICSFYLGPKGLRGAIDFMIHVGLLSNKMNDYEQFDAMEILGRLSIDPQEEMNNSKLKMPVVLVAPAGNDHYLNIPAYAPNEDEFPYEEIEKIINYKFKNRRLLFLAYTHVSVDLTHCYERLEWIGDAALDWIVTKHYFEGFDDTKWMTPARITLARQTAVCNEAFGRVTVHYGLQKFIRIASPLLQIDIEKFTKAHLKDEEERRGLLKTGVYLPHRSTEPSKVPPAPKVLGDIFESIAGAVFIDLFFNIEEFAAVFNPLIRYFLDSCADPYDLPDNPMHDFWHDIRVAGFLGSVEFSYLPLEPQPGEETTCKILVQGRCIAEGQGPNRLFARTHAARVAVEYIRTRGWRELCPL